MFIMSTGTKYSHGLENDLELVWSGSWTRSVPKTQLHIAASMTALSFIVNNHLGFFLPYGIVK